MSQNLPKADQTLIALVAAVIGVLVALAAPAPNIGLIGILGLNNPTDILSLLAVGSATVYGVGFLVLGGLYLMYLRQRNVSRLAWFAIGAVMVNLVLDATLVSIGKYAMLTITANITLIWLASILLGVYYAYAMLQLVPATVSTKKRTGKQPKK